jgi:hypothetical protein
MQRDLPLYHLALGNAQQAEQMVRDALSQAPFALLSLAARGLEDLAFSRRRPGPGIACLAPGSPATG